MPQALRLHGTFRTRVGHACLLPARRLLAEAELLRRAGVAAVEHDALTVAQAVAYSATVAIFPAMIVSAALVGWMPLILPLRIQLATFFAHVLPSNTLPLLSAYFTGTHSKETAGALVGSAIVSLTGGANVMATLMEGFRRAHGLPLTRGSFWPRRRRALALVPLSLLPMALVSALLVFGNALTHWLAAAVPTPIRTSVFVFAFLLRWALAVVASVGIIGVIYHLGTDPSVQVRRELEPLVREPWAALRPDWSWRASLPGAAVATCLWFVTTLVFGWYVTRFANYGQVYGSLGAGIALMAWLYIIALSVLMGSEYNAQRAHPRRGPALAELWSRLPDLLHRQKSVNHRTPEPDRMSD